MRRLRVQQPEHLRPEARVSAMRASWHQQWARRGLEKPKPEAKRWAESDARLMRR